MGLKIGAACMGLVNGILLARLLGSEQFGVYSIVIAAVSLLGTFAALGLPTLVTRDVAVHHAQAEWGQLKGRLVTSHRWAILASLFLVLLSVALRIRYFSGSRLDLLGWVMSLALVPLAAFNQLRAAILRGLHWVLTADIPDLLLRPLTVIMLLVAAYKLSIHLDTNRALLIQMIAALVALVVGSWLLARRLPTEAALAHAENTQLHWAKSTGVFFAITLVAMLEGQTPLYMLGYLATPGQAGLYQAANQVVSVVVMGLTAVNMPLQPQLAKAWREKDASKSQQLVAEAARLGTAFALIVACVLVPFAHQVLSLYGPKYIASVWALRILVIGQVINAISGSCGVVLAMTGHQRLALSGIGAALVGNLGLSWLLIPRAGIVGAAIAAVFGLLIWNGLLVYWAWAKTRLRTVVQYHFRRV